MWLPKKAARGTAPGQPWHAASSLQRAFRAHRLRSEIGYRADYLKRWDDGRTWMTRAVDPRRPPSYRSWHSDDLHVYGRQLRRERRERAYFNR